MLDDSFGIATAREPRSPRRWPIPPALERPVVRRLGTTKEPSIVSWNTVGSQFGLMGYAVALGPERFSIFAARLHGLPTILACFFPHFWPLLHLLLIIQLFIKLYELPSLL